MSITYTKAHQQTAIDGRRACFGSTFDPLTGTSSPPFSSQNSESMVSCSCTAQRSHRQSPPAYMKEVPK